MKLNMNEMEQVNGGTITIRNKTVYDSRTTESRTEAVYYIYKEDGRLKTPVFYKDLDSAIKACEKYGCTTEVIDARGN